MILNCIVNQLAFKEANNESEEVEMSKFEAYKDELEVDEFINELSEDQKEYLEIHYGLTEEKNGDLLTFIADLADLAWSTRNSIESLEVDVNNFEGEINALEEEVNTLEEERDNLDEKVNELEEEVKELENKIEELEDQLDEY